MPIEKPYGSWDSKLSAETLAQESIRYGHMCVDKDDLYWLESRASEKGRGVIVKRNDNGNLQDLLPKHISVRSKVHEYGSGDFLVNDSIVYFSNAEDQCIYRYNGTIEQITENAQVNDSAAVEYRYADYVISSDKKYLIQ